MCILWNWHSRFCILVHTSWSQWPQMFSWLTLLITSIVYMIDKITWIYNFLSAIELRKLAMWITLPWTFCHFSEKGVSLWMMQILLFCNICTVHEHAFIEVRLLFCIVLVCSEPQEVFKYMEYFKSLFYIHILRCYSNNINKTRRNSLLPVCTGWCKNVKQHTRTWYFAEKYMFLRWK